jgi:hypothetical protein
MFMYISISIVIWNYEKMTRVMMWLRSGTTENRMNKYVMSVANVVDAVQIHDDAVAARKARDASEPLLQENPNRFVIFPIQHHDLWKMYKDHVSVFWRPEEVDLSKDIRDWVRLTDGEQHFVKRILGFFAGSRRDCDGESGSAVHERGAGA